MRTCIHCNVEKNNSEFYRMKKDSKGKQLWCKVCQKDYTNTRYQWNLANVPNYLKIRNEYQKEYSRKRRRAAGLPERGVRGVYTGVVCTMIKQHHEKMKDDPEHLTTDFMQKMLGRKCNL